MKPLPRHLAVVLAALGVLAVLAALAADWNWARPAVVQWLVHKSGREIRVDDLQVRLDADWQPVVRLRGVQVANAPWASGTRPFLRAGEVSFTFDRATLLSDLRVVRELRLVDADLDLQREADGRRNWRLTRPEDTGHGRMRILRLRPERSHLTLAHRGHGLLLEASSRALPAPRDGYAQHIVFRGRYGEADWAGEALAAPVLTMVDSGEFFALQGEARSGDTTLAVKGRIADLLQLSAVDARVTLRGDTLAHLQPFLQRARWPASRPYRFDGQLVRDGAAWQAHDAQLQLGRSDLQGDARYVPAGRERDARASLQATLRSERLRLEDLPARAVPDSVAPRAARPAAAAASTPSRVLPQLAVSLAPLRAFDGRITLEADRLELPAGRPARTLQVVATLERGQAQVQLQRVELGGGRWQGRVALDARDDRAPEIALQLQARGLQPRQLWPALARQDEVQWPAVDGELSLTTLGPTLAAWWSGLNGRLDLHFAGGSLPRKLDARLGLHAGRMLGALLDGDRPVPIRCGQVSLAFSHGVGRTRELLLETERTRVRGVGSVHLAEESWALVLTPQAQGGTLPASIVAQGTFRAAKVELAQREPLPGTPSGAASGAASRCA